MADRDTEGQRTLIVRKITRQWNEKEKAYICILFAKSDLLSQSRVKHTLVNSLRRFLNPEIEHAYHKFSLLCFSYFSFILFIVPCKNDLRREFQTSKFFEKGADLVTFEG